MELFVYLVALLFFLAAIDLVVGVSNDAVNFLNSAIGSKVASYRTILIIASAGIILGSVFSEGMMEIARNGIFQPSYFTFRQIMIIFLAVMVTDILLLDLYNTLGLPTSTTVSLIFELLGASFAIGIMILLDKGEDLNKLSNLINYKNALTIIGGIFLSVFVSFITGSAVQYVTRFIFTFRSQKYVRRWGAPFSGIAIATIIYFLIIKGAEGSSIVNDEQLIWIEEHTLSILVFTFIICTLIILLLMRTAKVNPLTIVVLLGTFSLAMAFAGNDLVNFIGVSVAGLNSFQAWSVSNLPADVFTMEVLNKTLQTPSYVLLIAGVIMVVTLWTNAKSRKVTETEVSLGSQEEGDEKFKADNLSRSLVGGAITIGGFLNRITPSGWVKITNRRFRNNKVKNLRKDKPSFDLIRASVNLVTASALIAFGTSQKLPLSTTFVTFMVAMGTSFADHAWGRESAVYRVAGVLRVISGWLLTALLAFAGCATLAFVIYFTGVVGIIILSVIALGLLLQSNFIAPRKLKQRKEQNKLLQDIEIGFNELIAESKGDTLENLDNVYRMIEMCIHSIDQSGTSKLKKTRIELQLLIEENDALNSKIIKYIRKANISPSAGRLYILVFDRIENIFQSCLIISNACINHIANHHTKPGKDYKEILKRIEHSLNELIGQIKLNIQSLDFSQTRKITQLEETLQMMIQVQLDDQIKLLHAGKLGSRVGVFQTRLLLELNHLVDELLELNNVYKKFSSAEAIKSINTRAI